MSDKVYRTIIIEREQRVNNGSEFCPTAGYRIWLTLSCGHVIHRPASRAPRFRAPCQSCTYALYAGEHA